MLKIQHIHKHFGGVKAVNNADFEVKKHQITALVGPNGAGKTTLFDIVSGLLKADQGKIYLSGKRINKARPDQISNLGVSRTFQQVRLLKNLTILDHLLMVQNNDDTKLFKNILGLNKINKERIEASKKILKKFELEKPLDTRVEDLSYGQRKLLELAMALLNPHHLLLLDEPVAGVNPVIKDRIKKILFELKKEKETILLIEHDIDFVCDVSDHVIVLDEGKEMFEGTPKAMRSNAKVLEAYLGE